MRSRNIKPGFFKNDELADIDPLGRLLFIGLWCMSDREGRLENRHKKIKAEVLPYDACNITKLLRDLTEKKFIIQYSVNGCNYIQITNFTKHQTPHIKEQASTRPAPDLHQTCTSQAHLIPDSLIPDILITDIPESGSPLVHDKKLTSKKSKQTETAFPDDFSITPQIQAWAKTNGYSSLESHLDWFKDWAISRGKRYVDWQAAFRNCVKGDWAKLNSGNGQTQKENTNCINHPSLSGAATLQGRWYCRKCLDAIEAKERGSPKVDALINNLSNKLTL